MCYASEINFSKMLACASFQSKLFYRHENELNKQFFYNYEFDYKREHRKIGYVLLNINARPSFYFFQKKLISHANKFTKYEKCQ